MKDRRNPATRTLACVIGVMALAVAVALPTSAAAQTNPPDGPRTVDHYMCYLASAGSTAAGAPSFPLTPFAVRLFDQFDEAFKTGGRYVGIGKLNQHCNPTVKQVPDRPVIELTHPQAHLVCWEAKSNVTAPAPTPTVSLTNQFGRNVQMKIGALLRLCLPSWKNTQTPQFPEATAPPDLDHFNCYAASRITGGGAFRLPTTISSTDQYGKLSGRIVQPTELCVPVRKQVNPGQAETQIAHPEAHLLCFQLLPDATPTFLPKSAFIKNQFGVGQDKSTRVAKICVPSFKTIVPTTTAR